MVVDSVTLLLILLTIGGLILGVLGYLSTRAPKTKP